MLVCEPAAWLMGHTMVSGSPSFSHVWEERGKKELSI